MSIPVLRYYKHDDDGVNIWECLSCYKAYGVRAWAMDWAFCPHCGVKFTAVMPEDLRPEQPVWKYHKTPATREWVIQNRCTLFDDDPHYQSDWDDVITLDYPQHGAKSMLWWLNRETHGKYDTVEYRYFIRDKVS